MHLFPLKEYRFSVLLEFGLFVSLEFKYRQKKIYKLWSIGIQERREEVMLLVKRKIILTTGKGKGKKVTLLVNFFSVF